MGFLTSVRLRLKRLDRWLISPAGKTSVRKAVVYGLSGIVLTRLGFDTLAGSGYFDDKLSIFARDQHGKKIPIPLHLLEIVEEENLPRATDVPVESEYQRLTIRPNSLQSFFLSNQLEPSLRGYSYSLLGAQIGLPYNLKYQSPDQVKEDTISVQLPPQFLRDFLPSWLFSTAERIPIKELADDKSLLSTLILSEKAKKFLIRDQLERVADSHVLYHDVVPFCGCYSVAVGTAILVNSALDLHSASRLIRILFYTVLAVTSTKFYAGIRNQLSSFFDLFCDTQATFFGDDYMMGGIEYFEKLQQRNVRLREFLRERGEQRFHPNGDVVNSANPFIKPRTSIQKRLQNMRRQLVAYKSDPETYFQLRPRISENETIVFQPKS